MSIKTLCAIQTLVLLTLAGCGSSRSVTASQSPESTTTDSAGQTSGAPAGVPSDGSSANSNGAAAAAAASSEATTNSTDPLLGPSPDIPSDRIDAHKKKAPTTLPQSTDETDRAGILQKQEAARSRNSTVQSDHLKGGGAK
jgi:hypothetical protein